MKKPLGASVFLSDLREHCFPPAKPYENSKCWSLVCQCALSIHTCFSQAINMLAISASIRVRSFSLVDFTSIIWDKYLTSKRNLDKQNVNWVTLQKDGFHRPVPSDWKFIVSCWRILTLPRCCTDVVSHAVKQQHRYARYKWPLKPWCAGRN